MDKNDQLLEQLLNMFHTSAMQGLSKIEDEIMVKSKPKKKKK